MRRLLAAILILAAWSSAQLATQDTTPLLRQAKAGNGLAALAYNSNVVNANVLVVWYECFSGGNCATGPSISDTLGSTWHSRLSASSPQCGNLWSWTAAANGSGADTVTITNGGSFQNIQIGEYSGALDTLDVASSATGYGSTSGNKTTPSITTGTNGALILAGINTCNAGQVTGLSPLLAMSNTSTADALATYWRVGGAAGSTSATFNLGNSQTGNTAIYAMKAASALAVATQALPDASTSAAYKATLTAKAGSGSYTWTQLTGTLPLGLTLNSDGTITGTPTAGNGDTNMTFRVTDGASTTADSGNLTIHVGTSVSTPSHVQSHTNGSCGSGFSLGTVTAGNLFLITYETSLNNFNQSIFTDTQGTVFASLPIAGEVQSSTTIIQQRLAWGFAGGSGSDTLTCSGSAPSVTVSEISNIQRIFDSAVWATSNGTSASPITSSTITAPVAELVYALISPFTSTATMTAVAPYTAGPTISSGGTQITTEYNASASSGSNSASFTQSGNTDTHWLFTLLGLRPTVSGTAPTGGSKRKKGPF